MCKCTPNKRTPFCGAPGCTPPEQPQSTAVPPAPRVAARLTDRVTVAQLDKYVSTLQKEASKLRHDFANNDFLQRKAAEYAEIVDVLLALRRDKQMTTMGGGRVE